MNKAELIKEVAIKTGISKKDTEAAVKSTLKTISETLAKGEKVQLVGFGTFEVRNRAERKARNLHTQEEMVIPSGKTPAFKAGKELKEVVKKISIQVK
ncbi:DNA-binding protein HU-beta [Terribacillus aidingensis]|uniref:DNA-binding protein HU-beta n=2 Tax=Terribacillus aidingensis TaxID=586416 RepID=A0A285NKE6_9BACI|nr:HU family DNA-binding protein [Terribacillus aidingensis]SNZ09970.1 DNA-binding protein HU-beta [Terribacillus aidingensis]